MRKNFRLTRMSLSALLVLTVACGPKNSVTERSPVQAAATPRASRMVEPGTPLTIPVGTEVPVKVAYPDTLSLDSVQVFLGGELKQTLAGASLQEGGGALGFTVATSGANTGKSALRLRIFYRDGNSENLSQQLTFLSDVAPREFSYRVVREYRHDPAAYTQGLQYQEGWLYEGTGLEGSSSLRRVNLETGEVVQIRNLDQSLFGEGITVFGDRIYQLTYKSQVGFIYDKSTFQEIQKVYYQNREGWGLTHNGKELIMSDGTHVIYFLDPEMFTINRQLEVYDDKGPAQSLNELEYIQGKIWANRYYTDEIVIIDPGSGKVEGRINLKGILKATDRKPNTNVLNGIAWDPGRERIFVTGKYWPKLFEISLVPR